MTSFQSFITVSTAAAACCLLLARPTQAAGPPAVADDVRVQFYMLQLEQWRSQVLEVKFKSALAQGAATFCQTSLTACGGANSSDDLIVHFTPGYPFNVDSHYLALRLTVGYKQPPPLASDTAAAASVNLSAADTTSILQSHRHYLYEQLGYHIVYIDDQFYSVPPPHMANIIIVSASGGFTLLLIIIALVMRSCYEDSPSVLLQRKRAADRARRSQPAAGGRANGAPASGGGLLPGVDGVDEIGRPNPGFEDSQSETQACCSSQQDGSASPASAADGASAEAGRRRRLGKEAAVIDSSEQIQLSEAGHLATEGNGSLLGNGGVANSNNNNNNVDDEDGKVLEQ